MVKTEADWRRYEYKYTQVISLKNDKFGLVIFGIYAIGYTYCNFIQHILLPY